MRNKFSNIISVFALVIALTSAGAWAKTNLIGTHQIKNGAITAKKLKKNAVTTEKIKAGAITTQDVGANQITPANVRMPVPKQIDPPGAIQPVTPAFTPVYVAGTYDKQTTESVLQVSWGGAVASGPSTSCVFQLRVNGQEPSNGGGEVFAGSEAVNVSTTSLFTGLGIEPVSIEVWAKDTFFVSGGGATEPSCIVGPIRTSVNSTFVASEIVTG